MYLVSVQRAVDDVFVIQNATWNIFTVWHKIIAYENRNSKPKVTKKCPFSSLDTSSGRSTTNCSACFGETAMSTTIRSSKYILRSTGTALAFGAEKGNVSTGSGAQYFVTVIDNAPGHGTECHLDKKTKMQTCGKNMFVASCSKLMVGCKRFCCTATRKHIKETKQVEAHDIGV